MSNVMTAEQAIHHMNLRMSEREFQRHVLTVAEACHWWAYHTFDSRRSQPGFPDLVLLRDRVIYAELKSEKGVLSADQQLVIDRLVECDQTVYVWRPSDYQTICEVLA